MRALRQKSDVFFNRNHCRNERGQSVILVTLIIMSFMMFFTFCLNTGLLINAKISVQAAADAAAYAGAATQARQLNSISYLNYDMRRQLKKLIFRNNFVAGISSPNFPNPTSGTMYDFAKLDFTNGTTPTLRPLKVPIICVPVTETGSRQENCTFLNQRNSAFDIRSMLGVTGSSMSAITESLVQGMTQIANTYNKVCHAQSDVNFFVALQWLFRGDTLPTTFDQYLTALSTHLDPNTREQVKDRIKTYVDGLGIYPRNIISMLRAETLSGFINEPPVSEMTKEMVEGFEGATNAEAKERSILAFRSALSNLNHRIFDPDRLIVDEIMPTVGLNNAASAFQLRPITTNFNLFIQMMVDNPPPANPNNPNRTACDTKIMQFPVVGVPVGMRWEESTNQLSYAVRVHAHIKPRGLLFMPGGGELELQAVAGAKPFGSRIGKKVIDPLNEFTLSIIPPSIPNSGLSGAETRIPNVNLGTGVSMLDPTFLNDLLFAATNGTSTYNAQGIEKAKQHAMAPNPTEVGLYNILPPPPADRAKYEYEFLPYAGFSGTESIYKFYAPLYPAGGGDPNARIRQFIDQVFPSTGVGTNEFGLDMSNLGDQVFQTVQNYIANQLNAGQGEYNESIPFAAIQLPMNNLSPPISGRPFWLTSASQVMTSWAPNHVRMSRHPGNPPDFGFQPRFGFSVKFVALRDLMRAGLSTNPGDTDDLNNVTH